MIPRMALLILLAGGPMVLSGCSLLKAPMGMMSRAIAAPLRVLRVENDDAARPFRLETGEIERARNGVEAPKVSTGNEEKVAVR